MIEAFEIGISLALGDGVLEGVAAAKRDVHAVELAMAAGAVSVQRLREAAASALVSPRGKPEKPSGSDPNAAPLAETRDAPDGFMAVGVKDAMPLIVSPTSPAIAVPATMADMPAPAFAPLQTAGSAGQPRDPVLKPMAAGAAAEAMPRAPIINILRMEAQQAAVAPSSGGGDSHPSAFGSGFASMQPTRAEFPPPAGVRSALPLASMDAGSAGEPAAAWANAGIERVAAAPAGAPDLTAVPASSGDQAGEAASPRVASAPPGGGREQPKMEGDVFLDGTLVGRWMSDYLAREAGRAASGPTGFDSRRDPLLPGATVGM